MTPDYLACLKIKMASQIYFTRLNLLPDHIFSQFQALTLIRIDFQYVHVLLIQFNSISLLFFLSLEKNVTIGDKGGAQGSCAPIDWTENSCSEWALSNLKQSINCLLNNLF